MKIADMSPLVTDHKDGRDRTVGNWSFTDYVASGVKYRDVYHYSTLMVRYAQDVYPYGATDWSVVEVTIGHGTVSDQGGINALCGSFGFRMHRDHGHPRVMNVVTGEMESD